MLVLVNLSFSGLAEAATRSIPCKKVFLEISQNSQENTRASGLQVYLKSDSGTGVFL